MAVSTRTVRAVAKHDSALKRVDVTRAELQAALLEDLANGVPQAELARATGYSRERLRQLARAAAS